MIFTRLINKLERVPGADVVPLFFEDYCFVEF